MDFFTLELIDWECHFVDFALFAFYLDGVREVLGQAYSLDGLAAETEVLLDYQTASVEVPEAEEHATMHRSHRV